MHYLVSTHTRVASDIVKTLYISSRNYKMLYDGLSDLFNSKALLFHQVIII